MIIYTFTCINSISATHDRTSVKLWSSCIYIGITHYSRWAIKRSRNNLFLVSGILHLVWLASILSLYKTYFIFHVNTEVNGHSICIRFTLINANELSKTDRYFVNLVYKIGTCIRNVTNWIAYKPNVVIAFQNFLDIWSPELTLREKHMIILDQDIRGCSMILRKLSQSI